MKRASGWLWPIFVIAFVSTPGNPSAQEPHPLASFFDPTVESVASLVAQAPHSATFEALRLHRPLTMVFYDLTDEAVLAGVDVDTLMPVASAIKGPIFFYFLDTVPAEVWNQVPVEHWHARDSEAVPEAYRAAWETHRQILRDAYRMIVYSDNAATGNVLYYASRAQNTAQGNPIQAFNAWSSETISISAASGLREWNEGATNNPRWIEPGFNSRSTMVYGVSRFFNNLFTARDLARYYRWLYLDASTSQRAVATDLLSIVAGYPGFLEDAAQRLDATPISKDGFVGPGDARNPNGDYLTADAGLIVFEDGQTVLIITMAVNGGDRLDVIYREIQRILRNQRNILYWPFNTPYVDWVRSPDGPFGDVRLSSEAALFILSYLAETERAPVQGSAYLHGRDAFQEARAAWLHIFPDDIIPAQRTQIQNRLLSARYDYSDETLRAVLDDAGFAYQPIE